MKVQRTEVRPDFAGLRRGRGRRADGVTQRVRVLIIWMREPFRSDASHFASGIGG